MTGIQHLFLTSCVIAFATLVGAAVGHAVDPRALRRVLDVQLGRVTAASWLLVGLVIASEGVIGLVGVVATARADEDLAMTLLASAAVLYTVYAVYSMILLKFRPSAPCGCSRSDHPVSAWVVLRAAALAAAAIVGVATTPVTFDVWPPSVDTAISMLAGCGLTLLLWSIPEALHDPLRGKPATVRRLHSLSVSRGVS